MNSADKKIQRIRDILGFVDDKRQYANDWNNSNFTNVFKKYTTLLKHGNISYSYQEVN